MTESLMFEKSKIPSCTKYDTFKGLAQENTEKWAKVAIVKFKGENERMKLRRTNSPGPVSYKVAEALECTRLRQSTKVIISKALNDSYLSKFNQLDLL